MKTSLNSCKSNQNSDQPNPRVTTKIKSINKLRFPGFTLVELVVVITILAILGTIGFLSIGGYSSRARDSARVGDIANIYKSLDISIITAGTYPEPDSASSITYLGGTIWKQGTIGPSVITYLKGTIPGGGLNKKPVDPLSNSEYTYSSLTYGNAYQIKANYEGNLSTVAMNENSILPLVYSAPGNPTIAYIRGNYGGITAKTITGGITYVLAIPSIIGTLTGSIEGDSLSGTLLFNGKSLTNATTYNPRTTPLIFSGQTIPTDDTTGKLTAMIANYKTAYSSSDITSHANIANLLATTGSVNIVSLGKAIVFNQLGARVGTTTSGDIQAPPSFACGTSITDADTNSYNTVQIGTQCWMKTNLRTTKNPDGTAITKGISTNVYGGWIDNTTKYYSCPPNATNNGEDCAAAATYGMLYQWPAAMNGSTTNGAQGICPTGWHVPTDTEYMTLEEFVGMCSGATAGCSGVTGYRGTNQGSKLGGGANWFACTNGIQQDASNITRPEFGSSGFDAQPSGYRHINSSYFSRTGGTFLWSSTQVDASTAWHRTLARTMPSVSRDFSDKADGFSLRCIQG